MDTLGQEKRSPEPCLRPPALAHRLPSLGGPSVPFALVPPAFEGPRVRDTLSPSDRTTQICSESFGH